MKIYLEGTDAVGKTTTIENLKKDNLICFDRNKEMISKYMLDKYSTKTRSLKYQKYLKENDCIIIFLINNNYNELQKRIMARKEINSFDLEFKKYNEMYKETYAYMRKNNMLENKLFLIDVTNLSIAEQTKKVHDLICRV